VVAEVGGGAGGARRRQGGARRRQGAVVTPHVMALLITFVKVSINNQIY
jgi:hypothetical protein